MAKTKKEEMSGKRSKEDNDFLKIDEGYAFVSRGITAEGKRFKLQITKESCKKMLNVLEPNKIEPFIEAYDLENHHYLFDFVMSTVGDIITDGAFKLEWGEWDGTKNIQNKNSK